MSYEASVGICRMNEHLGSTISDHLNDLEDLSPKEKKQLKIETKIEESISCPWHKRNHPGHKGNFGLMSQCLDCMDEIEKGRCTIDVKNFDFDCYWQVKKFWDKVDKKGQDECWHWLGATKKKETETQAYFPAPFFSGKTQSAARVAFWTSRGFTGKMRTFHQPGCSILCCNPLHLRLREVESIPVPAKVATVNLSYGNIFEHARANRDIIESKL